MNQAETVERLLNPPRYFLVVGADDAQHEFEVLVHGALGQEPEILEDDADALAQVRYV